MKALFFVDTHGDKWFKQLSGLCADVDIAVCAGDLSIFEHNLNHLLKNINDFPKKVLMISSNHDSLPALMDGCANLSNIILIDRDYFEFNGYIFIGFGSYGFSRKEEEFDEFIDELLKKKPGLDMSRVILVTHAPPYNTKLDEVDPGYHVGCKTFTEFILKHQPLLAVSGHIHETWYGEDRMGKTLLINPGPDGTIIDFDKL